MKDLELMNDYMNLLRSNAVRMFPGAVLVEILITGESVSVKPVYKKTEETTRKTIDGGWS